MAQQRAHFMAVKESALTQFPEGFQKYVYTYFIREKIFGIFCYVAMLTNGNIESFAGQEPTRGIAPTFSRVSKYFCKGFPEECDLTTWIDKQGGGVIFDHYESWDDGCLVSNYDNL